MGTNLPPNAWAISGGYPASAGHTPDARDTSQNGQDWPKPVRRLSMDGQLAADLPWRSLRSAESANPPGVLPRLRIHELLV
jgi:hypothetical protein